MPQVNPIVIFMTVAYFAVIFGIGYATRRASADPMDYYVAGRKTGPVVNGAALAATFLSPASFLGLPAFIFLLGYPFLVGDGGNHWRHAAGHDVDSGAATQICACFFHRLLL